MKLHCILSALIILSLQSCTQVQATGYNSFLKKSDYVKASGEGWSYEESKLDEASGVAMIGGEIVKGIAVIEGAKTIRNITDKAAATTKTLSNNATKETLGSQGVEKAAIDAKLKTDTFVPPTE